MPSRARTRLDPDLLPPEGKTLPDEVDGFQLPRRGRPSKLTEGMLLALRACCRLEANPSNNTLAAAVGVNRATFQRWLNDYNGFRERLDMWKQEGLSLARRRAMKMATEGDRVMLKLVLTCRDPDFKRGAGTGDVFSGGGGGGGDGGDIDMTGLPDPSFL